MARGDIAGEVPGASWSLTPAEVGALPAEGQGGHRAPGVVSSVPLAAWPGVLLAASRPG